MNTCHRKLLSILTCFLLTIAAVSCKSGKKEGDVAKNTSTSKTLRAEGFVVAPHPFENNYTASGSLLPNEVVQILPEVSGRITGLFFKEGSYIRKGQLLVTLYDADIKAQLQKLKVQKQLQQSIRQRQEELVRIGGISQQDLETTTTQIQSIDADLAYTEAQLRKTNILAPFDGVIGLRNVSLGAIVTPGTLIATLQQVATLKMDFSIPDQYRTNVAAGKEVLFATSGSLDTFKGTIATVDPAADPATRTIRVRVVVPNNSGKLVPGSFANVSIPFNKKMNALMIPSQAIIPTTRDKKVALMQNGKATLTSIIVGTRTNDKVEILNGLKEGDTIITTGIMQVKNGMAVKIIKVDA